ncbi:hypothetical protein [Helicovermis profundi]|uniref:Uncharacterized protein n=1 Tax=Helicovermis profundi TaxID=3065157 RepID=A0AAU9ED59_9FIRM|nr:hypothetical protein HLPR_16150 [Clostridia bacterium S502]
MVLLIIALLFFIGTVINLINALYITAIVELFIGLLLVGIYRFVKLEEKKEVEFLEWLYENHDKIISERAYYDDVRITPRTELKQYQLCVSFLIVSLKMNSRYFIIDKNPSKLIGVIYFLMTTVLGWWGLPWGPIYTVGAMLTNIKGGKKTTVCKLLSKMKQIEEKQNKKIIA